MACDAREGLKLNCLFICVRRYSVAMVKAARERVGNNLGIEFEKKSNWLVVRPQEIETTKGETQVMK